MIFRGRDRCNHIILQRRRVELRQEIPQEELLHGLKSKEREDSRRGQMHPSMLRVRVGATCVAYLDRMRCGSHLVSYLLTHASICSLRNTISPRFAPLGMTHRKTVMYQLVAKSYPLLLMHKVRLTFGNMFSALSCCVYARTVSVRYVLLRCRAE